MDRLILTTPDELKAIIGEAIDSRIAQLPVPATAAAFQKEIINTDILCKRLDITEPTAIRWRKKGRIPFLTIGTAIRYDWNAVLIALENKKPQ